MITIEPDCIVEITVITLDGKRLIMRGILDGPIRFRSSVAEFRQLPRTSQDTEPTESAPPPRRIEGAS